MGNSAQSETYESSALIPMSRSPEYEWPSWIRRESQDTDPDGKSVIIVNELVDIVPGFGQSEVREKSKRSVKEQQKQFLIYLRLEDDFWHKLCTNRSKLADNIVKFILTSKWMWIWLVMVFVLALMCRLIETLQQYQPLPALLTSIWMLLHILTFNIRMTWKMLQSGRLWFKMLNWVIAMNHLS